MGEYGGPERRRGALTEEEIERIAEIAAERALNKVYSEVGKGVMKKIAWVLGSGVVALLMYLGQNHITLK